MKINCMGWLGDIPMLTNAFLAFFLIFCLEVSNKYTSEISNKSLLPAENEPDTAAKERSDIFFSVMLKELGFVLVIIAIFGV